MSIQTVSLVLLGYIAGLGSYWVWVIVDWHWHRQRKYYE